MTSQTSPSAAAPAAADAPTGFPAYLFAHGAWFLAFGVQVVLFPYLVRVVLQENEVRFGDLLPDVKLAGFPRSSNTYLCNNVTFVTGWLMSHPQSKVRLMRATPAKRGAINEIDVKLAKDYSKVPRVFVHWPSELASKHHAAGAEVMKSVIAAQLASQAEATLGDNAIADPTLQGGAFF